MHVDATKKIDTNVSIDNLVQSEVVKNLLVIVWIWVSFFFIFWLKPLTT